MRIETKFDLGDVVWLAEYRSIAVRKKCETCDGSGRVALATSDARRVTCPECFGHREFTIGTDFTPSTRKMTIGKVTAELVGPQVGPTLLGPGNNRNHYEPRKISYMCEETGVGSGNVWDEERFARTESEALDMALPLIANARRIRDEEQAREEADRARRVADLERVSS